jgi:alpha/beta superfamily hydrolase
MSAAASISSVELLVDEGVTLEAELSTPGVSDPRAAVVLCHPHPQYGGTMRSIVISELFGSLPTRGVVCLRFNFRGVEGSTGTHDGGRGECADAVAAIDALAAAVTTPTPIILAGWSFGGDVALSVHDDRLVAWLAVAPPLHFADVEAVAADPRPKHLVLAEHDEVRPPRDVAAAVERWHATTIEVVTGASHFFVGRTDAVVAAADHLIAEVAR